MFRLVEALPVLGLLQAQCIGLPAADSQFGIDSGQAPGQLLFFRGCNPHLLLQMVDPLVVQGHQAVVLVDSLVDLAETFLAACG